MHDTNPYVAPESTIVNVRAKRVPSQTLSRAIKHGAWLGLKWMTIIVGPVASLLQLAKPDLVVYKIEYARSIPSGFETGDIEFAPFGLYLFLCMWAVVIGAFLASVNFLFRRNRPKKGN